MGYYTSYKLRIENPGSHDTYDLIDILRKESEGAKYAISEDGSVEESCKWYEAESDLKIFSKKYPEVLFELHGEGEESGDIWIKYFKNGKCQHAKSRIVFERFDITKLI